MRFKLTFDNRTTFQSSGSGDVREVLVVVYGVEIAKQLIELGGAYEPPPIAPPPAHEPPDAAEEDEADDLALREPRPNYPFPITVKGFISPPSLNRSNRKDITLFVNGRWVQDIRLSAAVLLAYHTMLMVGRYPMAVIMVALAPEDVDVNVHPTKAEVRFRNYDAAFTAVERAIRKALTERAPVPHFEARRWDVSAGADDRHGPSHWAPDWGMLGATSPQSPSTEADVPPAAQPPLPTDQVPLLRVVGQIGAAYIVAEGPDGLYLIDQHAAHERVLYEAFSLQRAAAQIVSQALLEPVAVEVPPAAAALLHSQMDTLNQIGFSIEPFGGNTFLVRSLPTVLGPVDPARAVRVVVEDFEEDETVLAAEVEARLIARVCKRAAVRAGQVLSIAEQSELVQRLEQCVSPRTCPHGRPTMIHLSVDALERQFGRKG